MPTVLIVDDTAVDRRFAGGLIEESPGVDVIYADNGEQALDKIQQLKPDLVVTDLQMPEMDGLELVTRVRLTSPDVPVILMTAKGSEEIAVQALEQGASSYVPKSQMSKTLRQTAEELLAMTTSDRALTRLMECQNRIVLDFALENDPALVDALIDLIQQAIGGMGLTDHTGKFRIGVALKEALFNALYRGNLEISFDQLQDAHDQASENRKLVEQRRAELPYRDRKIHVTAEIGREEARFVVQDEGPGFNHQVTASEAASGSLSSNGKQQGRGIVLMHAFMDEMSYNDSGNQLVLVKRRDTI